MLKRNLKTKRANALFFYFKYKFEETKKKHIYLLLAVENRGQNIRCVRQCYWRTQLCEVVHVKILDLVYLAHMFL